MQICLLVLWGDSLAYTMARALAFTGHGVQVWVADMERHSKAIWGTPQRIATIPGVNLVTDYEHDPPEQFDRLIVQGHPLLLNHKDMLDRLASQADKLTVVSFGDRSRPYSHALKIQWRERSWYGPWFSKVDRVVYKDGYYPMDLMGLFKARRVVGFDAHSHFLDNDALYKALHATDWDADSLRPTRANFIGSRDPQVRGHILDSVEAFFLQPSSSGLGPDKHMIWHTFTDAEPAAALSPEAFLKVLSESDFTLAPPGYSLVTHRPIEALLRGSIPVLNRDELDLYDLGFVDGLNCIAVSSGDWPAAMKRILLMEESEVIGMRHNIQAMLAERVAYPALASDICHRLGL